MVLEKMSEQFTKYEIARILGARALQLAMDAPVLLKIEKEKLEEINYDVLKIAELEFTEGVLPITVKRPFPRKMGIALKKAPTEEKKKGEENTEDKEIEKKEEFEEKEIKEEGEIMELAVPEDEMEAQESGEEEGV